MKKCINGSKAVDSDLGPCIFLSNEGRCMNANSYRRCVKTHNEGVLK